MLCYSDPLCKSFSRPQRLLFSASITSWCGFDLPTKQRRIAELEETSSTSTFWDDPQQAQSTVREIAALREQVESWKGLSTRVNDAVELLQLAAAESDAEVHREATEELEAVESEVDRREVELQLSGPHDRA